MYRNSISEIVIHFAGKWPEGQMWKQKNLFNSKTSNFSISLRNI